MASFIGEPTIQIEGDKAFVIQEVYVDRSETTAVKTYHKELIMTKEAFEVMYNKWIRGVKDVD